MRPWEELGPYPTLDDQTREVVATVYDRFRAQGGPLDGPRLRFDLRESKDLLHKAEHLKLVRREQDRYLPTVLGLLYVPAAADDLGVIERLVSFAYDRYDPDRRNWDEQEVVRELQVGSEQLRRIAQMANELPLGLSLDQGHVLLHFREWDRKPSFG